LLARRLSESIFRKWIAPTAEDRIIILLQTAYPILLDLTGRTIVIIGGGEVAARKARGVLEAGAARVRCVAPTFFEAMPSGVEKIDELYRPEHLDGAALVFAATDRADVNEAVVNDAHARNLWVNRADPDDELPGDFMVPAKLSRGQITLTVSAQSPAVAAMIRDRLAEQFDPRWEMLANAMVELRPMIKRSTLAIADRRKIFREIASEEAMNILSQCGAKALADWLVARHPELAHV
jgi:precorrin-2 dehydrogenase/sirohydrochlorin ferrochelatase